MDWFKGKFKPENPMFTGKIYGFRLRFSQQNQSIEVNIVRSLRNYYYDLLVGGIPTYPSEK